MLLFSSAMKYKAPKFILRVALPWIWRILCTVGNMVQIYHISISYHQYPVFSQVNIRYPEEQEVPSVTFCFLTVQVLNWDLIKTQKADWYGQFVQEAEKNNLTISQNFTMAHYISTRTPLDRIALTSKFMSKLTEQETIDLTFDYDNFLTTINSFKGMFDFESLRGKKEIEKKFKVVVSMTTMYKCFTLEQLQGGRKISHVSINRAVSHRGALLIFKFNERAEKYIHRIMVSLSIPPNVPRLGFDKFLFFSSVDEKNALSYNLVVNELLSAPFGKCKEYSRTKWKNRAHCIDSCILQNAVNKTHYIPPGITLSNDLRAPENIYYLPILSDVANGELLRRITNMCTENCWMLDCKSRIFVPKKISTVGASGSAIILYSYLTPVTEVKIVPQLSFSEYFVDLTSTFGFWTGLNVLQTLTFGINVIRRGKCAKRLKSINAN